MAYLAVRSGTPPSRPSPWDLADASRKMVTVHAGLGGFAVTNMVLLVTFAANRGDVTSSSLDSLVALLVVAYISYVGAALLYANMVHGGPGGDAETLKLQYAIAATSSYRSIFIGWLALAPLFDTFGLDRLAALTGGLLLVAALGGWTLQSTLQAWLGYLHVHEMLLGPAIGMGAAFPLGLTLGARVEGVPSEDSVLALATVAFALGILSFVSAPLASMAAEHPRARVFVHRRAHLWVVVQGQATIVLLAFLWLAVVGVV